MGEGHSARTVPLTDRAAITLAERSAQSDGRVFPTLTLEALQRSFLRTVDRTGLPDLQFKDIRNEAIHRLRERGYTIADVQFITGRKTFASLERFWNTETREQAESQ